MNEYILMKLITILLLSPTGDIEKVTGSEVKITWTFFSGGVLIDRSNDNQSKFSEVKVN